jgi:hypothetical protein
MMISSHHGSIAATTTHHSPANTTQGSNANEREYSEMYELDFYFFARVKICVDYSK